MLTKKRGCLLTVVCVFYAYTTKTYGLPSPDPRQGNKIELPLIPAPAPATVPAQVQAIANTATQNVVAEGGVTTNQNNNGTSLISSNSKTENSTKLINASTESSSNPNVTVPKKHEGRENVPEFRSNYEEELSKKTTAKTQTLPPIFPPSTEASKIVPRKGAVFPNSTEVETETKSSSTAENAQKSVVNTVNQEKSSSTTNVEQSSSTNVQQKTASSTNVEKSTTITENVKKTSSSASSNKLDNITSTVVSGNKAAVNSSSTLNSTVSTSETKLVTSSVVSSTSTTTTTTTTTVKPTTTTTSKPRKPTVTIGSEDEPEGKENSIKAEKIPLNAHQTNTNFVVPIVAVILSVPLVAIVASVLYKKGSEWWQHRHYSRMDFLIDGMYNN